MIITQLSVFVENKPGRLCAITEILANNGIDISALSLADAEEYGILRLIVDSPDKARDVLMESGVIVKRNHVNAVALNDVPGGSVGILKVLAEKQLNVEYLYAFVGKVSGKALMVVRTDNHEKAEEVLKENGYAEINPADVYRI